MLIEYGIGSRRWRSTAVVSLFGAVIYAGVAITPTDAAGEEASTRPSFTTDLSNMTLEELADIEITSVSKRPERLSDAAASIYVITRDDIRRSGATRIPEILRLAPNLEVARVDATQYAITARGFNSTTANKLLVLIDGRSVYTPLYSGVFWDVQDVLIEDIDRIEVISGSGGTLWGANAVNGIINIITLHSGATTGVEGTVGGGTEEYGSSLRYGARLGQDLTYRLYAKGFAIGDSLTETGSSVHDAWHKWQAGFRVDSGQTGNEFTLQGDGYDGSIEQAVNDDKTIAGGNLLGRWERMFSNGSVLQVQAYSDMTQRIYPGTFGENLYTYDINVQHHFEAGTRHNIVWGAGYRLERDDVTNSAVIAFFPARRRLSLANMFVQDGISLGQHLELTLGTKVETNSYTGLEVQPNARLAWKPSGQTLLWSAISRAVRTPSRLDRDLFVPANPPFLVEGGPNFKSETLISYEIGYRAQPVSQALVSVSTFYNVYDRLRSVELAPGGVPLLGPFELGNEMEGDTYGLETWGDYRIWDWWQMKAGYNYLKEHLGFKSGSTDTSGGVQAAGNDPSHQVSVRSMMNFPCNLDLDAALRWIAALPNPSVPSYYSLDARIGWIALKGVDISLTGTNLLDRRHVEFGAPPTRSAFGRILYAKVQWNF